MYARERGLLVALQELGSAVLDIGCGQDPITPACARFDKAMSPSMDAHKLPYETASFQAVYSSHLLEHLERPEDALRDWWRVLSPCGQLILQVPHRDLYEKKKHLPSRFNPDHKFFLLPDRDEAPHTYSLAGLVRRACPGAWLQRLEVLWDGYEPGGTVDEHPTGDYSILGIWFKTGRQAEPTRDVPPLRA